MKANAPEKIYLHPDLDSIFGMTERSCESEIEYARTDAFIEKACDYLMEYEFNDSPTIADRRKRIDEFRNYMKGE